MKAANERQAYLERIAKSRKHQTRTDSRGSAKFLFAMRIHHSEYHGIAKFGLDKAEDVEISGQNLACGHRSAAAGLGFLSRGGPRAWARTSRKPCGGRPPWPGRRTRRKSTAPRCGRERSELLWKICYRQTSLNLFEIFATSN